MAAILLGTLIAQFDLFVVNVAAPSIQSDLHVSTGLVQIAVGGYSLTYGSLLVAGGRLGDAVGSAFLLKVGMIAFAAASVLCALCQTGPQLVIARLLQGGCAALMVPQVLALITHLFPPEDRSKATSWFGVTLGLGAVLGQALGGVLVAHAPFQLGWRSVFLVVVPVAVVAAWAVSRQFPTRERGHVHTWRAFDPAGLAGLTGSLLLIFVAVTLAPDNGWPWWSWLLIGAGSLCMLATIRWESYLSRRGDGAILDTALFRQRTVQIGLAVNSAYFLAFGGVLFVLTFTLQAGLHETAEQSGLTFVSQGAGFAVASLIGARVVTRLGPKLVTIGAIASSTACFLLLHQAHNGTISGGPGHLLPFMTLLGLGNGFAIPAMIASVLQIVPKATSGTASGILTTTQQVSMAFGVAIFGSIESSAVRNSNSTHGYTQGLQTTLLIATILLGLAAAASTTLSRRKRGEVSAVDFLQDYDAQ